MIHPVVAYLVLFLLFLFCAAVSDFVIMSWAHNLWRGLALIVAVAFICLLVYSAATMPTYTGDSANYQTFPIARLDGMEIINLNGVPVNLNEMFCRSFDNAGFVVLEKESPTYLNGLLSCGEPDYRLVEDNLVDKVN